MIYINEAHAADVWNIGESACTINYKHQTLEDRIKYAVKFKDEFDFRIPIYVDNMNNDFETIFSAWPFRYFIIKNDIIKFIPQPNDSTYDITEIFNNI